jgi:hypothetical protein
MTEQQHTELVREFTVKSPKHPYPALDVDAMAAEIVRLRVVAQANYRNMERLGVEVERLRALIDAVLALPTFNMTPYIQGVEPAGAALSDARHYGEWLESDHVLNALQVPQ